MPDRATYLSRLLLSRFRGLEGILSDVADEREKTTRRQDLVSKILAVEAGVVDGAMVQLVTAAVPSADPQRAASDRDHDELAAFLRKHLPIDSQNNELPHSRCLR